MNEGNNSPTEISISDIDKTIELLNQEPRKCSCGNGFPARYDVSSNGQIWDTMCIQCFQELTKDGNVIHLS